MESEIKRLQAEIKLLHAKIAATIGCLDERQAEKWKRYHEGVCYSMKIDPVTGESLDGDRNSIQTIPSSEGSES